MTRCPTPVTILTGFLGAGKTTLLNRILREQHGLRIGVLVNDFGAVNIDARLVAGMDADEVSLTNGCICCSMRGDLVTSVKRILSRPDPPDHLIVEASGISDPLAIAAAFSVTGLRDTTHLDGVIALVDAANARNPRLDEQLVASQIHAADIVVLNKIDLVDEIERDDLRNWIRRLAPAARIAGVVRTDVPLELLLEVGGRPVSGLPAVHSHDHATHYGSWSYRTTCPLAYRKVRQALESLPREIFRAKGFLALADAPNLRFSAQLVGKRVEIDVVEPWGEEPRETELVFIGTPGAIGQVDLARIFEVCATRAIPLLPAANMRAVGAYSIPAR